MAQNIQNQIFELILNRFPKKSDAVEELSQLFSIGKDAIYRRMRGESVLTPDELQKLAVKFNISLDALAFENQNSVFFTFNSFSQKINSFEDYLSGILQSLDMTLRLPNVKILYASSEIPVFYYCYFPELMTFKLYVWAKTIWSLGYLENRPFNFEIINPQARQMIEDALKKYNALPSVELWSLNIMDNTLNQIEYVLSSGAFENGDDALKLCDKLLDLARHMRLIAETGKKFGLKSNPQDATVPFELYHNEMVYTNNTILVKSPSYNAVFTTFENPNFLTSTDPRLCEHTDKWFTKVVHKSALITSTGEKNRNMFFNRLEKKVLSTRQRIEMLMTE